jgi:hypothetical protein
LSSLTEISELTRPKDLWQRQRFLPELNHNWDETAFELEKMTNALEFLNSLFRTIVIFYETPKKPEDDFNWFFSEDLDLSSYRGKYVAVYGKRIIGWGETSVEAYNMAKAFNSQSEPAITYIAESEDVIL